MNYTIRPISKADLPALKNVIDSSNLFPSEYLDAMTADFMGNEDSPEIWLTIDDDDQAMAVAFCAPEKMTEGTFNLYLIAVHESQQGKGMGAALMGEVEQLLKKQNARILIVETSGLPEFELTRKFYDQLAYKRVAVIPEFYAKGEDKVMFWKKLNE